MDGVGLRDLLLDVAVEAHLVEVPPNRPPWTDTPLHVEPGDQVTWLSWGRVYLIKPLVVAVEPSLGLLGRIDRGAARFSSANTYTFTAERAGTVQLAGRFPAWLDESGVPESDRLPYRAMRGQLQAVVARWPRDIDARDKLESLATRDRTGLCATESARLRMDPKPPHGWHHHPSTGAENVAVSSERGIRLDCRGTAGIIRRPADVPLTETLRLRWSWRIDQLPTDLPEDTPLTHDYVSVALEFDDGQDLTWYWSASLPAEYSFRCPMDFWRKRETHLVARSGPEGLGRWIDEERVVAADHRSAIGGRSPHRVVRAWLIACCLHQGGVARAEVSNLELIDGDRVTRLM